MGRPMKLSAYLDRVGFQAKARPDLETLAALHQHHTNAIPFENLDVQLGRKLTTGVEAAYDKLVRARRGGWCYEQNGLLGWALGEIGFKVMRASAGVMRETQGDGQLGNHLCLIVELDNAWLVDVGFGGSLAGPLPLKACGRDEAPYRLGLSETPDGYWRFWEEEDGVDDCFSFDFRTTPADETLMANKCGFLQTSATSPFVQNLVVQQRCGHRHFALRGRVLSETGAAVKHILQSGEELVEVLAGRFGLNTPEAVTLWPAILARHETLGLPGDLSG
jgi:N-hydroxyarylamine O-acetyltransferase